MGDASEYTFGETRKDLLDLIRDHGVVTPKQAVDISGMSHDLVRLTSSGRRRTDS